MLYQVTVRWWDGYLEEFDAVEVRFGVDLLYLVLSQQEGQVEGLSNRHIPLRHVRWFSVNPPTKEKVDRSS